MGKFYLLPIAIFIWFPVTVIVTYVMAVLRKDVNPIFPYISDTGTFSPESCIFGQMLNTGAILIVILVYVRYRHVRFLCGRHSLNAKIQLRNKISTWIGVVSCIGISLVGNFQETNILIVHLIGAIIAFGFGTIWQCLQTWISFKVYPYTGKKLVNRARIILSIICICCCIATFACGVISILEFKGKDITKWSKKDEGYYWHIASTINEWIMSISFITFMCSFTLEFRYIDFHEPEIIIWEHITVERSESSNFNYNTAANE